MFSTNMVLCLENAPAAKRSRRATQQRAVAVAVFMMCFSIQQVKGKKEQSSMFVLL
jgi:hypothetical protein